LKAGRLRNPIQVQEKVVGRGDYGGEEITWQNKTNGAIRASIKYLSGKDGFTQDIYFGKNIVEFKIRYLEGLSVKDRIVYDGRNFDIIPPIKAPNDVKKEMLVIAQVATTDENITLIGNTKQDVLLSTSSSFIVENFQGIYLKWRIKGTTTGEGNMSPYERIKFDYDVEVWNQTSSPTEQSKIHIIRD
jgi:head-tail adaptor